MSNLTENEILVLNQLVSNHCGEEVTSPYGSEGGYPNEVGPKGWSKQQRGGLVASLLKKGLIELYNGKEYSLGCDILAITDSGLEAIA